MHRRHRETAIHGQGEERERVGTTGARHDHRGVDVLETDNASRELGPDGGRGSCAAHATRANQADG